MQVRASCEFLVGRVDHPPQQWDLPFRIFAKEKSRAPRFRNGLEIPIPSKNCRRACRPPTPTTTFPSKRCRRCRWEVGRRRVPSTSASFLCFRPPPKSVLDYLNFDQLQPIFRTNCSNFLEMDKLIKVEARKEFSNGKYVLRERCDLQFAGESRAKYVSESAVSVAGRRRRRREENSSHMTPTPFL